MKHFWKLCPVEVIPGTTHTLVEVIHSANREHRHRLKTDSTPGYYSFMWSLIIPEGEKIPDDFDELLEYYQSGEYCHGLMRKGKTFNQKDFSMAVEKIMLCIKEITAIRSDEKLQEVNINA